MQKYFLVLLSIFFIQPSFAQTPKSYSAADILQDMKKLPVFGSVLYIAAHPDDENTRLLGYLANEKRYRTGYLSLTRGDGGQNLIGDEQGIDLGLIRTQELLAARRKDGAEQFFSRAYDFGFSKNPEEALRIWGHDKILSDVVWVIRKFRPDVVITRFPTTGEGGHGHHTASAILAGEAFDAAADAKMFPEQLKYVSVWQAKRLLWNTFNFGGSNTTRADQLQVDCGTYNQILGKSYGEIAAESRSQHKSQGFGVPAQRGTSLEYFSTIKGDKPSTDLMEGIDISADRIKSKEANTLMNAIIGKYTFEHPENSIADLVKLFAVLKKLPETELTRLKIKQTQKLIEACSGLFMEATAVNQLNTKGDSAKVNVTVNNRIGLPVKNVSVRIGDALIPIKTLNKNENITFPYTFFIPATAEATQPYWLKNKMEKGAFVVNDQELIGNAENDAVGVSFLVNIDGTDFTFEKPLLYKYTDPVKGEIYEPAQIINTFFINTSPSLILFSNEKKDARNLEFTIQANRNLNEAVVFKNNLSNNSVTIFDSVINFKKNDKKIADVILKSDDFADNSVTNIGGDLSAKSLFEHEYFSLSKISYDHIPDVFYNYQDQVKVLKLDMKTSGSRAGYIAGAGDKIPEALKQMGYTVTLLTEKDLTPQNLKQFDVIITGVRAYNIHDWLNNSYGALMQYVNDGGVLFAQYNTNNSIGPVKAKISPYPFTISRNRITDETAKVNFLLPNDPALNFPNKITDKDFDGWIQERSTYHAEGVDSNYRKILSMKDPGEAEQDGALIITNYGKGRFIYSGLVFFRELPAGVPGAYRLFANLIANQR